MAESQNNEVGELSLNSIKSASDQDVLIQGESQKKSHKILYFLKKNKEYFIFSLVLLVIYNFILLVCGFYPYGTKTILVSDSYTQIAEFFEYLYDVLSGEASLFYTSLLAGSFEVFSTIEYMLLCPFYLIVFFFGESLVFEGFNIAIFFILLFDGLVFLWFAKKYFRHVRSIYLILLAILYTFSGYILLNFSFVTWYIYPALILLVADSFCRLVKDGKIARFCIFMSWYVCECFSVGVSTNIILVILFTLYILMIVPKAKQKLAFSKLLVAYLISAAASIAILFPSIYALFGSGRATLMLSIGSKTYPFDASNFDGMLIDAPIVFFAFMCFVSLFKKGKRKEFKFTLVCFVVLIFPCVFNYLIGLLCGGNYNMFSNRFYFILEAFLFICSLKYFNVKAIEKQQNSNIKNEIGATQNCSKQVNQMYKFPKVLYVFLLIFFVFCMISMLLYSGENLAVGIKTPQNYTSVFKLLLMLFLLYLALFFIVCFFSKRKLLAKKIVKFNTIFIMVSCAIFNVLMFGIGTGYDTGVNNEINSLVSSSSTSGKLKDFYLDTDYLGFYNSTDYGLINSSVFSSLLSEKIVSSYLAVGLYSTKISTQSNAGSLVSDSLLGMNYYLSSYEQNRPYLELVGSSENFYLYKNTLAGTGAILVSENYNYDATLSSIENFENLKESYSVSGTLFEKISPVMTELDIDDFTECSASKVFKYEYTATKSGIVYAGALLNMISNDFQEENNIENAYNFQTVYDTLQDVGWVEAGETVTIYLFADEADDLDFEFYFLDYSVAEEFCKVVQQNSLDFSATKMGFEVSGTIADGMNLIVFAVNIDGMEYSLNGKTFSVGEIFGSFVLIETDAGELSLVANYNCPYLTPWLIIAIAMILIIIILAVIFKLTKFTFLGRLAKIIFVDLMYIFLTIFYLFSIILSIFV